MIDMDEVEKRLERRLDAQSADLKEHITLVIEPIRIQTIKTNGRVGVIEKMVWMAAGAVVILTPLTYYVFMEMSSLKEAFRTEARQAVDDRINDLMR